MRIFQIKIMDQVYEVEVEEINDKGKPNIKNIQAAPVTNSKSVLPTPVANPQAVASNNSGGASGGSSITSPMPGKIISIAVQVGEIVKAGDLILVLEAMKMENEIFCNDGGTIKEILTMPGKAVNPGDTLVVIG